MEERRMGIIIRDDLAQLKLWIIKCMSDKLGYNTCGVVKQWYLGVVMDDKQIDLLGQLK